MSLFELNQFDRGIESSLLSYYFITFFLRFEAKPFDPTEYSLSAILLRLNFLSSHSVSRSLLV